MRLSKQDDFGRRLVKKSADISAQDFEREAFSVGAGRSSG
jgi:hypothetical protein